MKKVLLVISVIAMAMMLSLTVFAFEGDGSEETPFLISNQAELELVTDFPDCHFRLTNDIELEGTWIPLCKQTSSGTFYGVFDGAGYTISNLLTDGSEGGLFKNNNGTIKNLEIIIASDGMTGTGAIANNNSGTISDCTAKGNITGMDNYQLGGICGSNTGYILHCHFEGNILGNNSHVGGICGYNNYVVSQCKFKGNVKNQGSSGYTGGICGKANSSNIEKSVVLGNIIGEDYTGGICGYSGLNSEGNITISNCYFIGEISGTTEHKAGISGYACGYKYKSYSASTYYTTIEDCYAVPTFNDGGYGISYRADYTDMTESYYDKTISGLSNTYYGTPKSTVAMKMKQTYSDWDFDTVWAIDKSINDGYPYLQWEYPDVQEEIPYTVNSVSITDLSGNELEEIPNESFYVEINITKNDNSKNADSMIIAAYDENGTFTDVKFLKGIYNQNQTVSFGAMLNNSKGNIGCIKSFVWNNIAGVSPLSNVVEISK